MGLETDMTNNLNGDLGLTKGTNLFEGAVTDLKNIIPDFSIFCRGIGGPAADRVFQLAYEITKAQISIYVRSNINERTIARSKMQCIYDYLKSEIPDNYLDCRCLQSQPQELGRDDKGRWLFTMTFECWKQENKWILDSGYWEDIRYWFDSENWNDGV